jgi:predicted nuclease with TOPRIM domain
MRASVSWLGTKTFLLKAWAWIKTHWYVPVLFIIAALLTIFTKGQTVTAIIELMDKNRENYEQRVKVLEESRENEIRRSEEVRTTYNETIRQIERQHNESSSSLDRKKRKRVKELVESFHQDPGSLSEALEKEFGFKNVE